MKGKMKFFNGRRRFGFISGDNGEDYFCHIGCFIDRWNVPEDGQEVEFEIKENNKGPIAMNIRVVDEK